MAWDDCQLSPGSSSNNAFACQTNLGSSSLFISFSSAVAIDQIIGVEVVVDVQHSVAPLPDYWRLGPSPDCRHDMLTASADVGAANAGVAIGFSGALVQDYIESQPRGLSSQARIKAVAYVPSPLTLGITNDTTYNALRLVLANDHTVNVNVCTGCTSSACLVLNSVLIRRTAGAFGGDITITAPGPANANWAFWRGTAGADCTLVPVRTVTWGSIKSLYR